MGGGAAWVLVIVKVVRAYYDFMTTLVIGKSTLLVFAEAIVTNLSLFLALWHTFSVGLPLLYVRSSTSSLRALQIKL